MYRKDVLERIDYMFRKGDLKPNFAKLAREMGCDYRTVKKVYEAAQRQGPSAASDPRGRFQEGFEPLLGVVEGEAVPDDDPVVIDDAAFVLELADVDADVKFLGM